MLIVVKFRETKQKIDVKFKDLQVINRHEGETYEGEYEVIPNGQTQILQTQNKVMKRDVIVRPIPQNYGLITYNGFEITVS